MRRFLRQLGRGGPIVLALAVVASARGAGPEPLARYVPREELAAYFEFEGLDARAEAWRETALAKVLGETTTGAMLRELATQLINGIGARAPAAEMAGTGAEMVRAFEAVARSGAVLALHPGADRTGPMLAGTLVLRNAAGAEARELVERLVRSFIGPEDSTQVLTRQDGRKLVVVRPLAGAGWAFWSEKDDLVIVWGRGEDGADPVIAALEGKRPSAVEHPRRVELAKSEDGFQPVAWGFLDPATFPAGPLDLKGIEQVDYRWGFHGAEIRSIVRLIAPRPRRGWLALFDQPALTAETIPPMPVGLDGYAIGSIDLARSFDQVAEALGPGALDGLQEEVFQQTGLKLKEDLLTKLGPRWAVYVPRETAKMPLTPWGGLLQWLNHVPRVTIVAETADAAALGRSLEALASTANAAMSNNRDPADAARFSPLEAPDRGFGLDIPPDLVPLPAGVRPCVVLGDRHAVLTTRPDWARSVLQLANEPGKRLDPELGRYPPGLIFLNVSDPRGTMPELLANLPFLVQLVNSGPGLFGPRGIQPFGRLRIAAEQIPRAEAIRSRIFPNSIALAVDDRQIRFLTRESIPSLNTLATSPLTIAAILPAVQASREARRRAQSVNNLKQIALAMHNFHSANNGFPAAAIVDKDDKPLLSWRVAILPFIDQGQALYNEFHLDEPWDSPHNKTLIERMPNVYKPVGVATPGPHMTFYQGLVGGGALFNETTPVGIQDITDGTSNTIMVVEAARAVPWTKPDDLPYSAEKPLPKFGGLRFPGGFNAAFADGSVRFLKMSIDPDVLRALFTRAGGEVIQANDF